MDYERLREDLKDYFGTAMLYNPMAVIELSEVETASNEELEQIAMGCGFNLSDYEEQKRR